VDSDLQALLLPSGSTFGVFVWHFALVVLLLTPGDDSLNFKGSRTMTKSYAQLKATIAKLEKEAAKLRAAETTKVVAQIKESIAAFGLTVEQLFGRGAKALKAVAGKALGGGKAVRKGAGIPKYRDPKTGKTWTGFGKAPGWIATARSRDKFLIDQAGVVAAPSAKEAAAPVAPVGKKAARKGRAVATPVKASSRTKKIAAPAVELAASEAKAEKSVAKKAAAKESAASKKVKLAKKVVAAPKAATTPKAAARAKKVASKPVKLQPAAKTRRPRATRGAAAPVPASVTPETTASAS
jgi:DNA-binding protein H-NS